MIRHGKIVGMGLHVPERCVENSYFNDLYKQDVATFLEQKRNIKRRYFMKPSESTSDLIVPAAEKALKQAGLKATDLNMIIVATDTPDQLSPATSSVVQHRLGAVPAATFDVNAACAGFVTALNIADKFIRTDDEIKNVLVVGAYGMSKFLDFDDYKIATLFADGAGAVVLQSTEDEDTGILASTLWADGQYHDAMGIYAGGTAIPVTEGVIKDRMHLLKFHRKIPVEFNAEHWPRLAHTLVNKIGASIHHVNKFFVTQINIDAVNMTMDRLELPREKSHNIMDQFGYTGSACIPMAMVDAQEKGVLKKGDLIILIGSGGGVAMGATAIRWSI